MFDFLKPIFAGNAGRMKPDAFRRAKPLRAPEAEAIEDDGKIVLSLPLKATPKRGWVALAARRGGLPERRTFELDEVGAFVWARCDGRTTVDAIARALVSRYKMPRVEAEASLGAFLQTLGRRGLVTLEGVTTK